MISKIIEFTPETALKHFEIFREKFKRWPVMTPRKPVRLPVRYYSETTGKDQFRMNEVFQPGAHLQILGAEPAKAPGKTNIRFQHPTKPRDEIVLTTEALCEKLQPVFFDDPDGLRPGGWGAPKAEAFDSDWEPAPSDWITEPVVTPPPLPKREPWVKL